MATVPTASARGWRRFVAGMLLTSLAIAAASLAVRLAAAVTYGLRQAYVGVPPVNGFVVFAVGGVTYGLASAASWRRYG